MKRIFIIAFALLLCLSAFGCQKTEDMSQLYLDAKQKTDSLDSFDAVMELGLIFDADGGKKGTESVVTTKLDRSNPDSPVYYTRYAVTDIELDHEYVSSTYFADEAVYEMSAMGEKYKTPVSVEAVESLFSGVAIDFPEAAFKKAVVDGNSVTAKTDAASMAQLLESFTSGVDGYFTSPNADGSFDFDYSELTLGFVTNDEGYFTEMSVSCNVKFEHLEGSAKATLTQKITYNSPGSAVTVEAPADLGEYTPYEEVEQPSQEEMEEEFMNDIFTLYNFTDGKTIRVENFDAIYAQLCAKYGKESVDTYIEYIEMLGMIGEME